MKNKKKKVFIGLLVLFVVFIIYTIFNQFDIREVQGDLLGKSQEELFGKQNYNKENGFYRLFSLDEPEEVDVDSDEVYMKYRRLNDPKFDNKKYIMESKNWKKIDFNKKFKKSFKKFKNIDKWFTQKTFNNTGWCNLILNDKSDVEEMKTTLDIYLKRYQKMIDSQIYEDITNVEFTSFDEKNKKLEIVEYDLIPNLFLWLKLAKAYNVIHSLDALEGNWERGIKALISHIKFLRKGPRTNKVLITDLINKANLRMTIASLNNLLNNKNCPIEMSELILEMPDLKYEEYSSRNALINEIIFSPMKKMFKNMIKDEVKFLAPITLLYYQNNRTCKLYSKHVKNLLDFEKTIPYLWQKKIKIKQNFRKGLFWWVQNPVGKTFLNIYTNKVLPNIKYIKSKNIELKSYFDMLKIFAELRLKYKGDKPVKEILKTLNSYNSLIDLCSGKPYKWNEEKKCLYSIGIDKKDNMGKYLVYTADNVDYPLQVVLFVK